MYVFSSYSLSSAGLEAVVIFSGLFLLHYEETSPDHILFGTFASNLDSVCTLKYQTPLLVSYFYPKYYPASIVYLGHIFYLDESTDGFACLEV